MNKERVALVTGASRGIGAAIAIRLANDGYAVAVNYQSDQQAADAVVEQIKQDGGDARSFQADVTDQGSAARLVNEIENDLGAIHALVANATGPQPQTGVDELTWDATLDQLSYFVKSPIVLVNALLPHIKQRNSGRIVLIASDVVELVPENSIAYTCAKAAQRSLARSWAKTLGPFGITVNSVSPGWVPVERHADFPREVFDSYAQDVPVRRLGQTADIAGAVAYLCSDEASFVNGVNLTVNGGKTFA